MKTNKSLVFAMVLMCLALIGGGAFACEPLGHNDKQTDSTPITVEGGEGGSATGGAGGTGIGIGGTAVAGATSGSVATSGSTAISGSASGANAEGGDVKNSGNSASVVSDSGNSKIKDSANVVGSGNSYVVVRVDNKVMLVNKNKVSNKQAQGQLQDQAQFNDQEQNNGQIQANGVELVPVYDTTGKIVAYTPAVQGNTVNAASTVEGNGTTTPMQETGTPFGALLAGGLIGVTGLAGALKAGLIGGA